MKGQPEIHLYMTGFDRCQVTVEHCEIAHPLITAAMEHDPKIAAMVFTGVAMFMKMRNLPPTIWEEFLSTL